MTTAQHDALVRIQQYFRPRASRPLVLSRTLFHDGRLSSECEQLGRLWVAFWAVRRVRTTYSPARGFGLVATVQVGSGRVVARGVIEKTSLTTWSRVVGRCTALLRW